MCGIKIRLKKSDEIILEKAYMGNFQIPNLAMSANDLQKTVEPNHEGNGQNDPWFRVVHSGPSTSSNYGLGNCGA